MNWADFIPSLIIALIGTGGYQGWKYMTAQSRSENARARNIDVTTEAFLRDEIKDLDTELSTQKGKRMDLEDALRNRDEQHRAEIAAIRAELDRFIHRVEKLEAWILLNTGTDPKTINGWKDKT